MEKEKKDPWRITPAEKRSFEKSLYQLLMVSPATGRPLGFWRAGSDTEGNILIGIGGKMGDEFWMLRISVEESNEFEVKAIKNNPPNADHTGRGDTERDRYKQAIEEAIVDLKSHCIGLSIIKHLESVISSPNA